MLISPQLQNSFYQEVQAPQAASTAVTHTHSQAVAGRGRGPAAGAVQGLCRVCAGLGTPGRTFCVTGFHNIPQ